MEPGDPLVIMILCWRLRTVQAIRSYVIKNGRIVSKGGASSRRFQTNSVTFLFLTD